MAYVKQPKKPAASGRHRQLAHEQNGKTNCGEQRGSTLKREAQYLDEDQERV
jgi:hypothetical protein